MSKAKSLCTSHYMRFWRYGSVDIPLKRIRNNDIERFFSNIKEITANGCWIWGNSLDSRGYGRMYPHMAHRWSYKTFIGNIGDELVVHHTCYTPPCVNPSHLEPATHYENIIEKGRTNAAYLNSIKENCINGHSLTDCYKYKRKYGFARVCKTCQKHRSKKYLESKQ